MWQVIKQWKCIPYFIFRTALLSFGEGIAQGVTFYSGTLSSSQKSCTNSTRNSHVPFTYIHLLFTFCSTCFTIRSLHPSYPFLLASLFPCLLPPPSIHIFFFLAFWEYPGHIILFYPYICWLFPKNRGFLIYAIAAA